jgi:hypothetical protein
VYTPSRSFVFVARKIILLRCRPTVCDAADAGLSTETVEKGTFEPRTSEEERTKMD